MQAVSHDNPDCLKFSLMVFLLLRQAVEAGLQHDPEYDDITKWRILAL